MIEHDGLMFRDLDHDGQVAPYEDWRLSAGERADDLVGRMTLAEKVGTMLHGTAVAVGSPLAAMGRGTGYDLDALRSLIHDDGVTSLITRLALPPRQMAEQNNALQMIAAESRLGIPLTISSDPRHHFATLIGASVGSNGFSQWPETLGFGAIGDGRLVERFGEIVGQEYRAVGINMALFPQADLATEPRWPRAEGTFGSNPQAVRALVGAFVRGLQGGANGITAHGVAAVVKHWVGYGASRDGFDGHNYYGRFSTFPGGAFDDHVEAFLDAFKVNVASVMPTYNILEGLVLDDSGRQTLDASGDAVDGVDAGRPSPAVAVGGPVEQVGVGFSAQLLTGLLRGVHGFTGVILSDWGISKDMNDACRTNVPPMTPADIAMPWGVDHLSTVERMAKGINAGLDQLGGEKDPLPLLEAVRQGLITEARIDESVRRILIQKFELGLFDNPFVDADHAAAIVGSAPFQAEADAAQRRALTLLEGNLAHALAPGDAVYLHGMSPAAFIDAGVRVVDDLADATIGVVRLTAPHQSLHPDSFFGRMQHEGDLDFKDGHEGLEALRHISAGVPTIVVVHLDRPAILTKIRDLAHVLLVEFGVSDAALVDTLLGRSKPEGRLPFALPSDMASVLAQTPDRFDDCPTPLYSAATAP
jgi:beta-glucosidase